MSKKEEQVNPAKDLQSWFDGVYSELKKPFPAEALSVDSSRGFDLTSIKAQYAVERLNEVVGVSNWRHSGEYEVVNDGAGVIFRGQLVLSNTSIDKQSGSIREAVGYAQVKRNIGDAYKSAKTDSLSKCASMFGLGNDIFKGLVKPPGKSKPKAVKRVSSSEDF